MTWEVVTHFSFIFNFSSSSSLVFTLHGILSILPSIYEFIHLSNDLFIHQSIYPHYTLLIHFSIYPSIYWSNYSFIRQSIHSFIHSAIHMDRVASIVSLFLHLTLFSTIYPRYSGNVFPVSALQCIHRHCQFVCPVCRWESLLICFISTIL